MVGHDKIEVDFRTGIFRIIEIEHGNTVDDADAHCCNVRADRILTQPFGSKQRADRLTHGNKRTSDGRGSRSAVGLDDVTIDPDLALAELFQLDGGPQRPADQPLNFLGSPGFLSNR